jgi:hypothetical protein
VLFGFEFKNKKPSSTAPKTHETTDQFLVGTTPTTSTIQNNLTEGIEKDFSAHARHTICLNRRRAKNMDWDSTFFIPNNNPFRKQWFTPDQNETTMLIVTEVNRCMPCVACQRQIGEVATMFYEIDEKYYCSKCGFELTSAKREISTGQKTKVFPQATS